MERRGPPIRLSDPPRNPGADVSRGIIHFGVLSLIAYMLSEVGLWLGKWAGDGGMPISLVAGFGLAAVLIEGVERGAPALYIGTSISFALAGESAAAASSAGLATSLGAVVGWWGFQCLLQGDASLPGIREFGKFLLGGCVLAGLGYMVAGGLLGFLFAQEFPAWSSLFVDWQAATVGAIIFGPFSLFAFRRQDFRPPDLRGAYELLLYSAILAWVVYESLTATRLGATRQVMLGAGAFLLGVLVAGRFGLRSTSLFLAMGVFFVPTFAMIFPTKAQSPFPLIGDPGPSNPVTLLLLSSVAITMLASLRDELMAIRIRLHLAMQTADLGVWEWTVAGWRWRGSDWCQRFGFDPSLTTWPVIKQYIHPEECGAFEESFDKMLSDEDEKWSFTCRMKNASGEWRRTRWHAQLLRRTADDEPAVVSGLCRDVTDEYEAERARLEAVQKEGELKMLRSQLNPHFLFNTLNSVRAMVGREDDKARSMITSLSQLLRDLLSIRADQLHSLKREIDLARTYLEIEKVRFGDRLDYEILSPAEHQSFRVPGMLVQTLVENAVKHGISRLEHGGSIRVETSIEAETLVIRIRNDGALDAPGNSPGTGFGLDSTRRRVELATQGRGTFRLEQVDGPAVLAEIRLPLDTV